MQIGNSKKTSISITLVIALTQLTIGCGVIEDQDIALCKQELLSQLLAPASAEFSEVVQEELDSRLTSVTGIVDSQNNFGAMIRGGFKCHVLDDKEATVIYLD
jgi:hypothetical protein